MNQNYSKYKQVDITTTNPLRIVLMLYDGAINFINRSINYAKSGDIKNKNIYANKARDILLELNRSLNVKIDAEFSQNLRKIYLFMNRHLMQANWNNDVKGMEEVIQLLSNLREAWQDVYNQKANVNEQTYSQAVGLRI